MSSPSTLRHTKLLLISMISFSLVGCQRLSESARKLDDSMPWNAEQAARRHHENSAARIVAIWSHDVLSTPNNGAVQGFGGRMYFYNRRQEAVKVEGQLIVYAFDDTGTTATNHNQRNPSRKYVFREDKLESHLSESELGPSYSFWIPWQKLGGDERKISLVPVFIPKDGEIINGLFSKVVLPGNRTSPSGSSEQDQLVRMPQKGSMRIDTFGHHDVANHSAQSMGQKTQTINVSPNLTRHMANAPRQLITPTDFSSKAANAAQLGPNPLPNYDQYNDRRRPTGIQTRVNPSGLKTIKLGPPNRQ